MDKRCHSSKTSNPRFKANPKKKNCQKYIIKGKLKENTMSKTQIAGTERPKRKLEEGVNGEKSENERPQKICRPWETTDRDQARDGDIEVVDPPSMEGEGEESDHPLLTSDFDNFLNLADVPFNLFAMKLSITQLRGLTQVSSSWRKRITENILENPARRNELRTRIQRDIVLQPYKSIEIGLNGMEFERNGRRYPSTEDISNAMWLSK